MAAPVIQADYDRLAEVARQFGRNAEAASTLQGQVQRSTQALRAGGWQGRGSAAFFAEMDNEIAPALQRLTSVLREAQKVSMQIHIVLRKAEEEAGQPFRGGAANGQNFTTSAMTQDRDQLTPPGAPDYPNQPASHDGSGEHGALGPPTDADWETHHTMSWAVRLAYLRGYDITASHMQHYLENSGEPLAVDVDRMMSDMPEFRQTVNQQFRQEIWNAVQQQIAANYTGVPMQFELSSGWRSDYYPSKSDYPNWYFGVGGFSYSQTAVVTVTPDQNGTPIVTVRSQVHIFDRYNWDAGKSVTIPSSGNAWIDDHTIAGDYIPDTAMGRLHQTGIAQEYDLVGDSNVIVTSYPYNPATAPSGSPSPGTGSDR